MRCNEAVLSTLLHHEINLAEAKGGQLVPLKDFTEQNDYFSENFSKDYYVTSKHTYKRHLFGLVSGLKLQLQLLCEIMSFVFTGKCVVWGCGCTSVAVIGN